MPDPTLGSPESSLFGVKLASLLAGFAGGVVSLSYLKELNNGQMFLSVITGALTAGYITPAVLHYVTFPQELENGVAFLIGLTAMNIVPGFINLADRFKTNPEMILKNKDNREDK